MSEITVNSRKIALFTDIHFGKKNNSTQHNEDCLDFVKWFCENVRRLGDITTIVFMGDWFENRNAVNVLTMSYSLSAMKLLNELGLPVYIIIGNHDLYHRENRNIYSTEAFGNFSNVTMIDKPTVIDNILLCPFLFKHEYPALAKYNKIPYWMGHFEFRNFIVTGNDRRMEHGPDHKLFNGPKYILSGHFHKRQANDNVIYIGNTFPTDYGDANDDARGMCTLDMKDDSIDFIDWLNCPKYRKIKLSELFKQDVEFPPKCRVRCTIDTDIGYSEAQQLKEEFTKTLGLREFTMEENLFERKDAIAGTEEIEDDFDLSSLDVAVKQMLIAGVTGTTTIDPNKLIEIYDTLLIQGKL